MQRHRRSAAGAVLGTLLSALLSLGLVGYSAPAGEGELVLLATVRPRSSAPGATATELTPERGLDVLGLSAPASVSGNPELPDLAADRRRFAFVTAGCRADSARLVLSDRTLAAELLLDGDPARVTGCGALQRYLVVFDVPAGDVPTGVLVG